MILVFYNKDLDVCIYEYSHVNGVSSLDRVDIFYNKDINARDFKEKIGVSSHFMDKILLNIQTRFKDKKVFIFNDSDDSLYDRPELVNMLFLYRRNITVFDTELAEENAKNVANKLFEIIGSNI